MRWFILACLLFVSQITPAGAQCPGYCVYLPVVTKPDCGVFMSNFKIVIGESTTNYALNPSGETTGNYAAEAGTTVTLSTTYQKYGLYSYRVETNANNEGIEITLSALTNAIHYVTLLARGTLPAAWDWSLDDSTFTAPTLIEQIDSNWALYGLQFPAVQANGSTKLSIHQNGAGSGDFYLDGIQVEAKSYWTTYCDGTQTGCTWNGVANASTSTRSAASRAGGRLYDLADDYSFYISEVIGGAAPAQQLGIDSYAILPGGEFNSLKIQPRVFTLTGVINASSIADLHSKQAALLAAFKGDSYPNNQPVKLRYEGATVHKEISLYYEGGLEGDLQATIPCWEKVAVRFMAPDPYWYEIGESAALLDTNDSATFRTVAARLKSTGQWSALGPPNAAGTYTDVRAFAEDATYIYIGGNFLNFDNIANADYIVRYNKQTGIYSAMGTGANLYVLALAIGPDGSLYAAGDFSSMGGVANTAYIAKWDGSAWNALGTGMSSSVNALAFGADGYLYAAGGFSLAGGVGAVGIAKWSGSAWSAVGSGVGTNAVAYAIATIGSIVYLGGSFTTVDGVTVNYIARWNGSSWSALSGGMSAVVYDISIDKTGIVYAGGNFVTAGGVTVNYVAKWNGSSWLSLGSGVGSALFTVSIGSDDTLWVGGSSFLRWNSYAWAGLDIDLPGGPVVYRVLAGRLADPVIPQKYDLFLGFNTSGTGNYAGKVTPSNEGSAPAFPQIVFERSGGTTATVETLRNETTGKELLLNYSLLSGEKLTIDLSPTRRTVTSSFFGSRPDAVLANSDWGTWALLPGSQDITSFVATSGSPTVTAWMIWREGYASY